MMSERVYWEDWDGGRVATHCDVQEKPTHSRLLDPSGKPMQYEQRKVGFNLTPRERKK